MNYSLISLNSCLMFYSQYVVLYRDKHLDSTCQDAAYQDRVEQQDENFTCFVLKNVSNSDVGKYECQVFYKSTDGNNNPKIVSAVNLTVKEPGESFHFCSEEDEEKMGFSCIKHQLTTLFPVCQVAETLRRF